MPQLGDAVRACGFAPKLIQVGSRPEIFVAVLHAYLLSGIPVVLSLADADGGHAVTAVGFLAGSESLPALESAVPTRSSYLCKLYVHDDRLGPYARARVVVAPETEANLATLLLVVDWPNTDNPEVWLVTHALAPLYPKIQLPVRDLIGIAYELGWVLEAIVAEDAPSLQVDLKYERSGEYLGHLSGTLGTPGAEFLRQVLLPRWCAVVRWYVGNTRFADFVFDTTEVRGQFGTGARDLLRGIVCYSQQYRAGLRVVADWFNAPFLG